MRKRYKTLYQDLKTEHEDLKERYYELIELSDQLSEKIESSEATLDNALINYNQFDSLKTTIDQTTNKYNDQFSQIEETIENIGELKYKLSDQTLDTAYELERLRRLNNRANRLLGKASSYSLSNSFEERRKTLETKAFWLKIFFNGTVISISIIIITLFCLDSPTNIQSGLLFFLKSISLTSPLIWAASKFSKNHYESIKLEEFYAQKVALALAYIGYKEEIEMLSKDSEDFKTLLTLMKENIAMIAKPSDSIFSKDDSQHLYQSFLEKMT